MRLTVLVLLLASTLAPLSAAPDTPATTATPTLAGQPGLRFLGVNRQGFEEYLWEKDRSEMILVPAGSFLMGRPDGEWYERPVREVTLSAYLVDKYEVSVGRYGLFLSSFEQRLPHDWKEMQKLDKKPVINVSWFDASQYAYWSGKRLPTEAEWERAAVGGLPKGNGFPWGKGDLSPGRANYDHQRDRKAEDWRSLLQTPGSYVLGTSPVGAMDMAGNVSEWCLDWYAPTAYKVTSDQDPEGPSSGEEKAVRGGSFLSTGRELLAARRDQANPRRVEVNIGFRTVLPVADIAAAARRVVVASEGVAGTIESDETRSDRVQTITPTRERHDVPRPEGAPDIGGFRFRRVNSRGSWEYTFERDRFDMVYLPAGTFRMGSADPADRCEGPVDEVTLGAYLISKFEVTVSQYEKFLRASGHRQPPNWKLQRKVPEAPVNWVAYGDAVAYANWCGMRLPTEAEWEYAARGDDQRPYPWGGDEPTPELAVCGKPWVDDPYQSSAEVHGRHPQGQSPFGVYDMAGNLWEWTGDWFGCGYPPGPRTDPRGEDSGKRRVARGGSWREDCSSYHRASTRMSFFPEERLNHLGFRVVKSLTGKRLSPFE